MVAKNKISSSQLRAILPPREHLAISTDIFGCQTLEEKVATGYWVEAKDIAKILQCRAPHNKRFLVRNVSSIDIGSFYGEVDMDL